MFDAEFSILYSHVMDKDFISFVKFIIIIVGKLFPLCIFKVKIWCIQAFKIRNANYFK